MNRFFLRAHLGGHVCQEYTMIELQRIHSCFSGISIPKRRSPGNINAAFVLLEELVTIQGSKSGFISYLIQLVSLASPSVMHALLIEDHFLYMTDTLCASTLNTGVQF